MIYTMYIGGLALEVDENTLAEFISSHNFAEIRMPKSDDGKPRGFAYVDFESEADALNFMKSVDNTEIEGNSVFVRAGKPKKEK